MWAYIMGQLPKDQYPGVDGEEVVKAFKKGECSFDQVVIKYGLLTQSLAIKMHVVGYDNDDMFQEFLIKLNKCCRGWNPTEAFKFSTYYTNSCVNHWKWLIRKSQTNASKINSEEMVSLDQPMREDDEGDTHQDMKNVPYTEMELDPRLLLVSVNLTPSEERFVNLIVAGYSKAEISRIEGCSRVWVSQVLKGVGRKLLAVGEDLQG